jgi:hypothetical protein
MDNVYIISCGKLDKRDFFTKFVESLSDTLVITKKNNSLNKKQLKLLRKEEVESIDLDDHTADSIKSNHLMISYGIDDYGDLLKLKDKFKSLIILSSKGDFTPTKQMVSKKFGISQENIFLLYSESSKKFFYKVRDLNSPDGNFDFLTKEQTFTIINREIRLNKIIKL